MVILSALVENREVDLEEAQQISEMTCRCLGVVRCCQKVGRGYEVLALVRGATQGGDRLVNVVLLVTP